MEKFCYSDTVSAVTLTLGTQLANGTLAFADSTQSTGTEQITSNTQPMQQSNVNVSKSEATTENSNLVQTIDSSDTTVTSNTETSTTQTKDVSVPSGDGETSAGNTPETGTLPKSDKTVSDVFNKAKDGLSKAAKGAVTLLSVD